MTFFDYGDINTKTLRAEYKQKVNAIDFDRKTKEQIVEEMELVFKMNNDIASQVKLSVKGFSGVLKLLAMVVIVAVAFFYDDHNALRIWARARVC